MPGGMAWLNPTVTTAPVLTAVAPPAGSTARRDVVGRRDGAVESREHPLVLTTNAKTVNNPQIRREILT